MLKQVHFKNTWMEIPRNEERSTKTMSPEEPPKQGFINQEPVCFITYISNVKVPTA